MRSVERESDYANIVSTAVETAKEVGFMPKWLNTDGSYIHAVTTQRAAVEAGKKLR